MVHQDKLFFLNKGGFVTLPVTIWFPGSGSSLSILLCLCKIFAAHQFPHRNECFVTDFHRFPLSSAHVQYSYAIDVAYEPEANVASTYSIYFFCHSSQCCRLEAVSMWINRWISWIMLLEIWHGADSVGSSKVLDLLSW